MKDVTAEMERFMTAGAIVHGNPRFSVREDDAPGALGYAADVFAVIAGAERYELRSYLTGAPSPRTCGESEREWAALLRDLHLRDEALPALVVRSRTGGAMFLVFGRHGGPLGVIRLDVDGTRGFRPPQIAATRRFLDEHGAALTHWIVDGAAPQQRAGHVRDRRATAARAGRRAGARRFAAARALSPAQRPRAPPARRYAHAAHRRARRFAAGRRGFARAAVRVRAVGAIGRRFFAVLPGLRRAGAPARHGAAR